MIPGHDGDGDSVGHKPKGTNGELADPIKPPTKFNYSCIKIEIELNWLNIDLDEKKNIWKYNNLLWLKILTKELHENNDKSISEDTLYQELI